MVLFSIHSVESTGHNSLRSQHDFIPSSAKPATVKSGGWALGALGITMLIAGPAQASPDIGPETGPEIGPEATLIQPSQPALAQPSLTGTSPQLVSSRTERLQQLQAGVSAERRIQAQRLAASSSFSSAAPSSPLSSAGSDNVELNNIEPSYSASPTTASSESTNSGYWADGVYLYGQQPVANQLATAYFVFESQDNNVTGAFYMPSSSFDCVQGQVAATEIQLNVTDSYSQETSQYELALATSGTQVASVSGAKAMPPDISGFHSLPVSDHDRTLLSTCQARL